MEKYLPNQNRIFEYVLYLMLLSPLLSYFSLSYLGYSITYYFTIFFSIYGILFMLGKSKSLKIPKMVYLLILYSLYISIWSFWNGGYDRRGLLQVILNRDVTSIIFIIIIIYNTNFSDQFIKRSINMIKVTVILAAIVSVIQVVNYNFLDANPIWAKFEFKGLMLGDLYKDRRASIFGYVNQNETGLSFLPLLSVLIGVLLAQRSRYSYIFLMMGSIVAFLSNARYVMIAFILLSFQIIMIKKNKFTGLIKYIIVVILAGIFLGQVLIFLGYDFSDWFYSRLFSEGSIKETTRYRAIENFIIFFSDNILFGTGVHMTRNIEIASKHIGSSQIHVGYLSHIISFGILGSYFLFGFWFLAVRDLYKTAKRTNYWGSFFAFLIFLWANVTLVNYSIFFYGIIFAFVFDKYFTDNYYKGSLSETKYLS